MTPWLVPKSTGSQLRYLARNAISTNHHFDIGSISSRWQVDINSIFKGKGEKMAITKRPAVGGQAQSADDFIAGAPDAAHEQAAEPARRRKAVISLGVDLALLKRLDARAARFGLSRAAAINLAMARFVDSEAD
ncbi:hypothetical protein EHZ19_18695 [Paraburkholderia bannensis]|nr:hypothetical protein [Paraburkholderia bannensis]RQM46545.1 hypothetical protein EHZ19_18695 [Paraburkholderia bannensis]